MKLTFKSDDMTYSLKHPASRDSADPSAYGWLFGEVIRVCAGARPEQVAAEIIDNLHEDFCGEIEPVIDDARGRMIGAAFDLLRAWKRHDIKMGFIDPEPTEGGNQ